jgi:hypothetical protein
MGDQLGERVPERELPTVRTLEISVQRRLDRRGPVAEKLTVLRDPSERGRNRLRSRVGMRG